MKQIIQATQLLTYFEANDPRNKLGVQLRIWSTSNNTEIIVRVENHLKKAGEKLSNNGRLNNGQIDKKVLHFLQDLQIIQNPENWTTSASRLGEIHEMDEYEDKHECIYFVFFVEEHLINF